LGASPDAIVELFSHGCAAAVAAACFGWRGHPHGVRLRLHTLTMTNVLITIDTELRPLLHGRGVPLARNIASSIFGEINAGGAWGINWQMDRMEEHGLKGVFFVDPMPAVVYGEAFLQEFVPAIIARGHEVQLHIHTEWLQWTDSPPVARYRGRNISDFDLSDQKILVRLAADLLHRAGAPRPIAFRAGHLGANDDTLMALAANAIPWDSSFGPLYPEAPHRIGLPTDTVAPAHHCGVVELPISGLYDRRGHVRPAQICAVSTLEMEAALQHAASEDHPAFVVMSHSFEMLTRDRLRVNLSTMKRFEQMCHYVANNPSLRNVGFTDLDASIADHPSRLSRLGPDLVRTGKRLVEQAIGNLIYERQLSPFLGRRNLRRANH
jgi:hypothetical protein